MNFNIEPIKSWFGFTRRERRSSFILLLLIVVIITLRYTVPERLVEIEDIASRFSAIESITGSQSFEITSPAKLFPFDPNIVSYDTLLLLGLDTKEANTLINYRRKGGIFRKPSDIGKIYGLEETKAEELIPYVELKPVIIKSGYSSELNDQSKIDINRCDSVTLLRLPGIGPILSVRIIKFRNLIGGFARIDQLKEVYGLTEETFYSLKDRFFVDTTTIVKINVNQADYNELNRHPYLENYEIQAILKYRELKGSMNGITDLIDNNLITLDKARKVGPYLNFEH